jgi:hypothetical protein
MKPGRYVFSYKHASLLQKGKKIIVLNKLSYFSYDIVRNVWELKTFLRSHFMLWCNKLVCFDINRYLYPFLVQIYL